MTRVHTASLLIAIALAIPALAQPAHPDLQGIWNSATATPLERPARLKDKAVFTPAEAAEWERQFAAHNPEPSSEAAAKSVGTYNVLFRELDVHVLKTLRTSIVTDPPDGRIPAFTPGAATIKARKMALLRHPTRVQDLGLQDRCLSFVTAGPPMLPYSYNSNYHIIQAGDRVLIQVEMAHDTRIISLDRDRHLPPSIRSSIGDSIGRWEGQTLVIDTTNFTYAAGFYGDAGGNFPTDLNLHVIERISLFDRDTILYRFEVDDRSVYSQSWKGELTFTRAPSPIYEYACHEGNYSIPTLLAPDPPEPARKP